MSATQSQPKGPENDGETDRATRAQEKSIWQQETRRMHSFHRPTIAPQLIAPVLLPVGIAVMDRMESSLTHSDLTTEARSPTRT